MVGWLDGWIHKLFAADLSFDDLMILFSVQVLCVHLHRESRLSVDTNLPSGSSSCAERTAVSSGARED